MVSISSEQFISPNFLGLPCVIATTILRKCSVEIRYAISYGSPCTKVVLNGYPVI